MDIRLLEKLIKTIGVSGDEPGVAEVIRNEMKDLCDEIKTDNLGSVICTRNSSKDDAIKILLDAHMDSIGLMVKQITEEGFVKAENIGGVDTRILPGSEVLILGKKPLKGIFGMKPPHLSVKSEEEKAPTLKDLYLDTGYNAEKLSDLVRVGDYIVFVGGMKILNNKFIQSPYLDNRAGVLAIIEIFRYFREKEIDFDLTGVFSVREEVGLAGAKAAGNSVEADMGIVIDVTHGRTYDENTDRAYSLEKGTAIGAGPNVKVELFEAFLETAKDTPYQTEVMEGDTGTNAWVYQIAKKGIASIILSFPLRYMHTSVETMAISDFDNLTGLVCKFLEETDLKKINDSFYDCGAIL